MDMRKGCDMIQMIDTNGCISIMKNVYKWHSDNDKKYKALRQKMFKLVKKISLSLK